MRLDDDLDRFLRLALALADCAMTTGSKHYDEGVSGSLTPGVADPTTSYLSSNPRTGGHRAFLSRRLRLAWLLHKGRRWCLLHRRGRGRRLRLAPRPDRRKHGRDRPVCRHQVERVGRPTPLGWQHEELGFLFLSNEGKNRERRTFHTATSIAIPNTTNTRNITNIPAWH